MNVGDHGIRANAGEGPADGQRFRQWSRCYGSTPRRPRAGAGESPSPSWCRPGCPPPGSDGPADKTQTRRCVTAPVSEPLTSINAPARTPSVTAPINPFGGDAPGFFRRPRPNLFTQPVDRRVDTVVSFNAFCESIMPAPDFSRSSSSPSTGHRHGLPLWFFDQHGQRTSINVRGPLFRSTTARD